MSTIEGSLPTEILELSPYAPTRSTIRATPLDTEELRKTETYWRACNYLSLGMIFLVVNRVPRLQRIGGHAKEKFLNQQIECRNYANQFGVDEPEAAGWVWPY